MGEQRPAGEGPALPAGSPSPPPPSAPGEGAAARPASFQSLSPQAPLGRETIHFLTVGADKVTNGGYSAPRPPSAPALLSPHLLFMQEKPLEVMQVDSRGVWPVGVAALGERDGV